MAHWFRVWHTKHKPAAYLSHLDLMRFWERAVRRSGLPIAFSQGFNPHPRLSSPMALGTAIESDCELVEIALETDAPQTIPNAPATNADQQPRFVARGAVLHLDGNDPTAVAAAVQQVREALAKQLIDGVAITGAEYAGEGARRAVVESVSYRIGLAPDVYAARATQPRLDALMAAPWHTDRKQGSGAGRSEADVRPRVTLLAADDASCTVRFDIHAVDGAMLRPRDLLDALGVPWAPESGIVLSKSHMTLAARPAAPDVRRSGSPIELSLDSGSADEPLAEDQAPSDIEVHAGHDPSP